MGTISNKIFGREMTMAIYNATANNMRRDSALAIAYALRATSPSMDTKYPSDRGLVSISIEKASELGIVFG